MKKVFLFLLILIPFVFSACSDETNDWQMVRLGNHQSIKVPSEWVVTTIDEIMYFSDKPLGEKDVTVYMFQSFSDAGYQSDIDKYGEENVNGIMESNQLCESFQAKYNTYTEGNSNGADLGTAVVSIDKSEQSMSFINLSDEEPDILFYVWEENVNWELLKKIANTYDGYTIVD